MAGRLIILSITFVFFCLSKPAMSQATLSIRSADSTAFYLFLSGSRVNESAKALVSADSIPGGKIPIDLLLSDSITTLSYTLDLNEGYAYVYELFKVGKEFQLLRFSQSFLGKTVSGEPGMPSGRDSSYFQSYQGPRGCLEPLGDIEFDQFISELKDEFFESRRLSAALNFTRQHCLTVKQLNAILAELDLEDRKLELVAKSLNGIFDQGHFMNLSESFRMESSLSELEKLQRQLPRQN